MINWVYFPKSSPPPEFGLSLVEVFEEFADSIDSTTTLNQHSDTVMARLRPGLEELGFREEGKSAEEKIVVPVLFGRKGKILKCFNADAHAAEVGWVLEVEAGCWLQCYAASPERLCRHRAEAALQSDPGTRFKRIPPLISGESRQPAEGEDRSFSKSRFTAV